MKQVSQRNRRMDKKTPDSISRWDGLYQECRAAFAALNFLTILPINGNWLFSPQELGKSIAFYPIIGAVIGLLLLGVKSILSLLFPSTVVIALVIMFWSGISGALHLDGLLDTCDGVFGGKNPEERLKIMKDERVGAFALIGGILIILIKYISLEASVLIDDKVLLLAPIISRWGMTLAIVIFPYARKEGLGYTIKQFTNWKQAAVATIFTIIIIFFISGTIGLIIIIFSVIIVLIIPYYLVKKINGLTGDNYGAINEIIEVWVLLVYMATMKFI